MGEIDQEHCPICGREFDTMEPMVFFGARGSHMVIVPAPSIRRHGRLGNSSLVQPQLSVGK